MSAPAVIFVLAAIVAVFAAVMVITPGNPIHSVLWLILNLVSLAVMYYVLSAPFLMAVQLIVYAGAIVVLFLFVVMLLGSRFEPGAHPHLGWLRPAAFVAGILFLAGLIAVARLDGSSATVAGALPPVGDAASIGRKLYTTWLLPFEATSILLLTALVGAMYLGRHGDRGTVNDFGGTEDVDV